MNYEIYPTPIQSSKDRNMICSQAGGCLMITPNPKPRHLHEISLTQSPGSQGWAGQ